MGLTEKDVRHVEELAHLELGEDEVRKFLPQLDSILQYMQKLNELDTSEVEPMAQVTTTAEKNPTIRSYVPQKNFEQDEALANAPEPADGHFKVPHVIERD